jgi:hypothetical protein
VRRDHVGQLAPFGDFALADGDGVLFRLDDLGAYRFGGGKRGGPLGRFLRQFDSFIDLGHLDKFVALGRERPDVSIVGDARFLNSALGSDARALTSSAAAISASSKA